jgi:CheY-like chemotaxis protein
MTEENKEQKILKKKKYKLLIVDDSSVFRHMFVKLLASDEIETESAVDPIEAIEMMNKEMPSCILSDFEMPNMSGLQFCKYIKSNPKFQDIPFLILSMVDTDGNIIECLEAGADDYLVKGTNKNIIEQKIKLMIEIYESRKIRVQQERLKTYTATVISLNHEWNNTLSIMYPLLEKLELDEKALAQLGEGSIKNLTKFKLNLIRIETLVKSFQDIKNINFETYISGDNNGEQMLKNALKD